MSFRLTQPVLFEEEIKKSRFLTQIVPLESPEQANELITELSTANATHNCWAWKFGAQYRFSDDGEPGGTAGRPMLAAIEHHQFDQVLAVCTRWYGGIKLGTGGLQRAYSSGVNKGLQDAPKIEHIVRQRLQGHCPYSEVNLLKARLQDWGVLIEEESFGATGGDFIIASPLDKVDACLALLIQITNGAQEFSLLDN